MEQLNYNINKRAKNNVFTKNRVSNYNKKNFNEINPYPEFSTQENETNIKTFGSFNINNPIKQETKNKKNEKLIKQNIDIFNYNYSFPTEIMNTTQNNTNLNIKNISNINNSLMEQYSLKRNLQSHNYLNYLQKKRNTYDGPNNEDIKNLINSDIQKLNISEMYEMNTENKNVKVKNNKSINNYEYEKNILSNKLNLSKSTNDCLIGDDQDMLIEYNNVPVIYTKRNNYEKYLNLFSNENMRYIFINSNYKNRNNLTYEDNNDISYIPLKNETNTRFNTGINYESYINNTTNKNRFKNIINKKKYNIDLSNINNNGNDSKDKNYHLLLNKKKRILEQNNIFDDLKKKDKIIDRNQNNIVICGNHTLDKYELNNDNFNFNFQEYNKTHNENLSKTQKIKNEISKSQNKIKKYIKNNNSMKIHTAKGSNDIKNKNLRNYFDINGTRANHKININNNNDNKKQKINNYKSKKDLFFNKQYQQNIEKLNILQKKIKSISPESKYYLKDNDNDNDNVNNILENKQLFSLNFPKKINNSKKIDDINENLDMQKNSNSQNKNKNINNKNLSNTKIILFKKYKNGNIMDVNNSVDKINKDISNLNYNLYLNSFCGRSPAAKKIYLEEFNNSRENLNYLETKVKTSRQNNSKVKIQKKNIIFSKNNLINNSHNNFYGHKSSLNISKNNQNINKNISEKKVSNSHINSYIYNNANELNNYNLLNINSNDYNPKYNYNYNLFKNISKVISNKDEENENKEKTYKTQNNININTDNNKFINFDGNNFIIGHIKNENSSSILKNINYNNQIKNNKEKLFSKKDEIKSNKDIFKNNEDNINTDSNISTIKKKQINNYLKQIKSLNKKLKNKIKIKKYSNIDENNKSKPKNKNQIKTNNNIININNNTSNVNVLNVKNSSINICFEKKDKIDSITSQNIDYINSSIQKENNNYKNKETNDKNEANELFKKNKIWKNLKIKKPSINKPKSNYINLGNENSYINLNSNKFRYINSFNINKSKDNIAKSYKSFLINNNNSNKINDAKKLINYNSEEFLLNLKNINKNKSNIKTDFHARKTKLYINNPKEKNNINNYKTEKDKCQKDIKNNILNNNLSIIKPIESKGYDKKDLKIINIPLVSINNLVKSNILNNSKNKNPLGIYTKPNNIASLSKSKKKNIKKSKSENKFNKYIHKNVNKNNLKYSLKNTLKTSKSLNSELYFNTSPTFYLKEEILNKKMNIESLNSSLFTKNILICNNYSDNESNSSSKNKYIRKKSIIINEIYQKSFCFFNKIYNYYIKPPKIEKCIFVKNTNNNKNIFNNSIKEKTLIEENKKISITNRDNYNEINNEEKNNESSQNGLLLTFGEMNNNKKNSEKSYTIINSNNKNNNICNFIDNIIEDSDLDIYRSLQEGSSLKKNDKIKNEYSDSNINISQNEDLKIYDSLEKDKNININTVNKFNKSTKGKEIKENFEDKNKTIKKEIKHNNLEKTEKGLKILGKLVLRRGGMNVDTKSLFKLENSHTQENIGINRKKKNIINKSNELFNIRKEIESNNIEEKNNTANEKYYKSLSRDIIIQGISKIENVFEKNGINNIDIEIKDNKINTYDGKNKKYYKDLNSNYKENEYLNIMNYSEILKTKIKTLVTKSKSNLGSSNDNNTLDSYLYFNNTDNINNQKKENGIISNKNEIIDLKNINNKKDILLPIKCNLLNDEYFNNSKDLLTYSEEDANSNNKNNNITSNLEESENYLEAIKKKQLDNIIKHDIIFLLNILVKKNYSSVLNQITQKILYKNNSNIINNNNDIIDNENIIKNIIFAQIIKGEKYIYLYAKICYDLNNNIINAVKKQTNLKNKKEKNFKDIISDECISILNNFKNIGSFTIENRETDENYYYLRKKIIGYVSFVYELIYFEILKQQFGFFILEQLYIIYNNGIKINNIISELFLEAIINLINKLGKLFFVKNNTKLIQSINNYIDKNIQNIIYNENNQKLPNFLKYNIMNLIERRNNHWKESIFKILEKKDRIINIPKKQEIKNNTNHINNKNINNNNNKIVNKEKKDDVNESIIEEDLINYISYFTEENNKGKINIKNNIEKSYNWKIIEELINDKNYGLESIINYFISICAKIIDDDNKIIVSNDYIKNIIEYYANNLSKKSLESIHNEMIKTFLKIDEFINKNENMYKILGNLLFILIDNKLYHIKYFNHYLKLEKQTQINLAIITKYCIISSGKFAKKFLNDFKQTKLFINSEIFTKYVSDALKDLLYFIQ